MMSRRRPDIPSYSTGLAFNGQLYTLGVERIQRSIDRLGLPPEQLIVVGSAALYLAGVSSLRYPRDVDVVMPVHAMQTLGDNGLVTPSGVQLSRTDRKGGIATVLTAAPSQGMMGVDIITRFTRSGHPDRDIRDMVAYDEAFYKGELIEPHMIGDLKVATLEHMLKEYSQRGGPKAGRDRDLVRTHIRKHHQ